MADDATDPLDDLGGLPPDAPATWGPGIRRELDDATRERALEVLGSPDAPRVRRPTVHQSYGGLSHVCDYVETDGTTSGACHLIGPHLGCCDRCVVEVGRTVADEPITVAATATDCVHQAAWELVILCPHLDCEVHR